jgi:hypothetical protein
MLLTILPFISPLITVQIIVIIGRTLTPARNRVLGL